MKLSTDIKHLNIKENIIFLLCTLIPIWIWMYISSKTDIHYDRGVLTIIGMVILTSLSLILFFSKNKIIDFFITIFFLTISSLIIVFLSLTVGLYIGSITGVHWTGLTIPLLATGILVFLILRRLFSFPDNKKAFWTILVLPLIIAISLDLLHFYDGIFAYDYGIGFPIAIYLSLLFISIGILCRQKTAHNNGYN